MDFMDEKHVSETGWSWLRSRWAYLVYGFLLAILLILGIRFLTYKPSATHYHANFAVFIDGQQVSFKDAKYYQEVKLCTLNGSTPQARVHMHDETPGVIHVHDAAVTWGAFFQNLGWNIGPDFLYDGASLHVANETDKLNIVLDGENLTGLSDISNQTINDKDRLLVSFGSADQTALDGEYKVVPNDAAKFDAQKDPASCKGPENVTTSDRLKHLF
jgi:hypothetical protein